MKKTVIFFMASLLAVSALANPVTSRQFQMKTKDGNILTVKLIGDEHMSYYVDVATGKKMQTNQNGLLEEMSDETFRQTLLHAQERRARIEQKRQERLESYHNVSSAAKQSGYITNQNGPKSTVGKFRELKGVKKGLVILVNFSDKEMTFSREDVDAQFNQQGYNKNDHIGSVRDYFYDQSYGQFTVDFDVIGPYTVSNNTAYYGQNVRFADGTIINDVRCPEMVTEACKAAYQDGTDFSKYDWDNDGEVEQIFFLYAGNGEATLGGSNTIWPHHYTLTESLEETGVGGGPLHIGGMTIDSYACSNELFWDNSMDAIGTVCHEFSHCLGFPDLYDIDYSGGWGMDQWDIMSEGENNGPSHRGEVPCGYSAYERWMAGWLQPVTLKEATEIKGMKPLIDSPTAYIIYNDGNENEFMILENRTSDRWFTIYGYDFSIDMHGMLITHVDYDAKVWEADAPNDDPDHQRVTIVPASEKYNVGYDLQVFGGRSNIHSLTPNSHVNAGGKWYATCSNGTKNLNFSLNDIYQAEDMTVSFNFVPDNISTDIKTVANTPAEASAIYNVMGQCLQTHNKGIVIVNNRKMLVR